MTRVVLSVMIIALSLCNGGEQSLSQTTKNTVQLMIGPQNERAASPPAFVFVKGRLSGVVPGVVFLSADESAPIEIGLAQFKFSPLYSFEFGPDAIKRGTITLITTNYKLDEDKKIVFLNPNTTKTLTLNKISDNSYSIILPASENNISNTFKEFWTKGDNHFKNADADIPVKSSDNYTNNSLHLSYNANVEANKTVLLQNPADWSGAHYASFPGVLFDPFRTDSQKWTITSNPEGATIFTADGDRGKTNSTISITKSLSSYIILQMTGYLQCVQTDCNRSELSPGSILLKCDLKKTP
jgi:hypothetical protein